MSQDLVDRVRSAIDQSDLVPPGSRVIVGYSGGADSTCLLHVLHRLGHDVVAGHLHHGQRPEADEEQERCQAFCDSLDVPFATGKADVPMMARDLKVGIEEAGRLARYQFLESAAHRLQCDRIATAHTRDDHVETVLLNLVRGSGLHGLGGIPERRGKIVRPLLGVSRAEARDYCERQGLWFHDDPANDDPSFSRSRLRRDVVPVLRSINERVDEAVCRLSEIARDEDRFLNSAAAAALESAELRPNGHLAFLTADCEVVLDRKKLEALPAVLVRRAVRLVVSALGAELDFDQTQTILQSLAVGGTGSLTAEGGNVVLEWSSDRVHARELEPVHPFRHPLVAPGVTICDELGWKLTVSPTPVDDYRRCRDSLDVVVDAARVRLPLHLRSRSEGDAMAPLGMSGKRSVADLLSEAGLTLAARDRLPIVCDLAGPIWIPGVALADRVKISDASTEALLIRFEELKAGPGHNRGG